ncbi:helix-turn-helix domain-containing protein [Streptomyces purpurascens]|uniref:helix-turn-helix domain-containing protein n=1 Tax=Streptomyces purpurascens TaxID=1924 RepID=UPI003C2C0B3F
MSKRRLVITAVVVEGRSQGEVARAYGVSQGWVSRLVGRYRAEGEAAFEPRSRRPKTSPTAHASLTHAGRSHLRRSECLWAAVGRAPLWDLSSSCISWWPVTCCFLVCLTAAAAVPVSAAGPNPRGDSALRR